MTAQEWAALALQSGAGLAGGLAQGRQSNQSQQEQQRQNALAQVYSILGRQQDMEQGFRNDQLTRATQQAQMSPLGGEQAFVQKQRLMQALLPAIAGFQPGMPTDPAIAGAYRPPTNILSQLNTPGLQQAFGDNATATSLMDRRKMMAMINPDYEFSSMADGFGMGPQYDQSVSGFQMGQQAQLKGHEATQRALMEQQRTLAMQEQARAQSQLQEKKGGGIMGKIGGILKGVAPIAALAIPGIGPLASAAIAGGGMAAGNLMQGGGVGSSLLQGGLGAAGGAMAKSAMQGNGLNPFNNGPGVQLNNQMTPQSLPVSGQLGDVAPRQQLQAPLPNMMQQSFSPFQQGQAFNLPNLPMQNPIHPSGPGPRPLTPPVKPTGMNPEYGYPLANAKPPSGNGSTLNRTVSGGQFQRLPAGAGFLGQIQDALSAQPFSQVMQTPMGGLMAGALGAQGRPAPLPTPRPLPGPQQNPPITPIPGGNGPLQLGPGPQPRGLLPQYGESTQQNIQNILQQLNKMGPQSGGPQFNQAAQPYLAPEMFPPTPGPGVQFISPEIQRVLQMMRNPQLQQQFGAFNSMTGAPR